ncbi:hypothetical protein AAE478_009670 [Parahypoxylon ruwenzoriense]
MARNPFAFGTGPWDPTHRFETSWLVSPIVLGVLRLTISLYAFATLLFNIGYQCAHASLGGCEQSRAGFSYFTVLTYWGLAFYFLFAGTHTLSISLSRSRAPLLSRWPRPLQALHALLYSTAIVYPFLVTAVYWGVLYRAPSEPGAAWFPSAYTAWSNVSQHLLNSVFAALEIALPRTAPPPWIHALWLVALLALYLALAYVTRATKGFYTYGFLDPAQTGPLVAAYVFGIGAAALVVFAVVRALLWFRRWLTEDKLGFRGRFAAPRSRGGAAAAAGEELEMGRPETLVSK